MVTCTLNSRVQTLNPQPQAYSHLFFWSRAKRLQFLMDTSDAIEAREQEDGLVQALNRRGKKVCRLLALALALALVPVLVPVRVLVLALVLVLVLLLLLFVSL